MLSKFDKERIERVLYLNEDIFTAKEWVLRNIAPKYRLEALQYVLDNARWDGLI